ncbi:MAG: hypothetical protein WDW38_000261 [Sanguina aurantia]
MDSANQDEARKCGSIAKDALLNGDAAKAEKWASKALRLAGGSSVEYESLLVKIQQMSSAPSPSPARGGGGGSTPGATPPPSSAHHRPSPSPSASGAAAYGNGSGGATPEGARQRATASSAKSAAANGGSAGPKLPAREVDRGTPEQRQLAQHILKAKDYYAVMDLQRGATDDDVKKAYRKLALKLHPDKNQAAQAGEAFKALSKAFSCLTDPDKRAYYDRTGWRIRGKIPQPPEVSGCVASNRGVNLQRLIVDAGIIIPILLLFMFMFLSSSQTPDFATTRDSTYPREVLTKRLGVPFYVKSQHDFEKAYALGSQNRVRAEGQIESEYYDRLRTRCQQEKIMRDRAWTWGNREAAKAMKLAACEEFQSISDKLGVRNGYNLMY